MLSPRPASSAAASATPAPAPTPSPIELVVPRGTPIRVALEKKIPIKKNGDPVAARVVEPVYAFDRVVIPAGSELTGKVSKVIPATKTRRTEAILNGDFTPLRTAEVEFDTLILKDGTRRTLDTTVSPAILNVVRLVSQQDQQESRKPGVVQRAKTQASQEWRQGLEQIKAPGKMHRAKTYLEEIALRELPYRRQYLPAGSFYDAELDQPLDCGPALVPAAELAHVGDIPPADSVVEARLLLPLSSATASPGTPVEAVITKPLFSSGKELLLPVGTRLDGVVVRAQPARRMHHDGQLRFVIRKLELPSGTAEMVDASIQGLEVGRQANLALDAEGGTRVKESRKRYLTTALQLAIATSTMDLDAEHHIHNHAGDPGNRGVAGGSGFRLIGMALGFAVQSRVLGQVLGFYGAGWSVYSHFLTRGHDVVLAKDTPMEIGFGSHVQPAGN
ncbi:MAG TPA: hypothetical protein VGS20_01100 [Candidatus Acidoferrales bacterium]|nr:hypothetical protein [Candidatus Acidoferrales bacterium]